MHKKLSKHSLEASNKLANNFLVRKKLESKDAILRKCSFESFDFLYVQKFFKLPFFLCFITHGIDLELNYIYFRDFLKKRSILRYLIQWNVL